MKVRHVSLIVAVLWAVTACGSTSPPAVAPTTHLAASATVAPSRPSTVATPGTTARTTVGAPLLPVWSSSGGSLAFRGTDGVALDPSGFLYVMDSGNDRVQKLDPDGRSVGTWGTAGDGDGQFACAPFCMLAVDRAGMVFVTDSGNDRVEKFDGSGRFIAAWGGHGDGEGAFDGPFGIAVDGKGDVYVGDVANHRVQKFRPDGTFVRAWGRSGTGDGEFTNALADLAVSSGGDVYVTDRSLGLQRFDAEGRFVGRVTECGDLPLRASTGVVVGPADELYVFDLGHRRICHYDRGGGLLDVWDGAGGAAGPFARVGGIAVQADGALYIGEPFDGRVRRYQQP